MMRLQTWLILVVVTWSVVGHAVGDGRLADVLRAAPKDIVVNADGSTNDTMPALAVLPDGTTWVAWHAYRDRRDRVLARKVDPGGGLGPIHQISGEGTIHDAPVLVVAGAGKAWIFWETCRAGRWHLMGRRLERGRWQAPVMLSDGRNDAMMPAAGRLGSGRLLLAWTAYESGRFRIWSRLLENGVWKAPVPVSAGRHDSFRPAVAARPGGEAWVFWDSYGDGNYAVFGRRLLPERGPARQISPPDAYCLTPTALATPQGICVAWLQLQDVVGGAGVISQMHTLRMVLRGPDGWHMACDDSGSTIAATLTHGIMVKIEPKPEWKLGYMGRCRVPMLIADGQTVWLLWDRKRNPPGHPAVSDGELVGRPCRDGRWGRAVVLHQGLIDYHVPTNPEAHGGKFFFVASQLPRQRRRIYHRVVADLNTSTPMQQAEWIGWRPVMLPLPTPNRSRHRIHAGGKTYQLFWADLHNHSTFTCDGEGEVDELLRYARDRAQLDVVAVTDNDDVFDDPLTEAEYAKAAFLARSISRPGEFLALPGYEWTSHLPRSPKIDRADPRVYDFLARRKLGYSLDHRTVIYPLAGGPLLRHTEVENDIQRLFKEVEAAGGLALPQHAHWTPTGHPIESGVEVASAWGIYIQQAEGRYHRLLNQGYRYAFMGHSDSHRRNPGLGGALTGIYAEELTDAAILEAIKQRRVFATNGSRIILDSRANGQLMGTEVRCEDAAVEISLDVIGTKPIVEVTLVRDGKPLKTFTGSGKRHLRVVYKDEHLSEGCHWYYWRVVQEGQSPLYPGNAKVARGHLAWSSPHWVTVAGKKAP